MLSNQHCFSAFESGDSKPALFQHLLNLDGNGIQCNQSDVGGAEPVRGVTAIARLGTCRARPSPAREDPRGSDLGPLTIGDTASTLMGSGAPLYLHMCPMLLQFLSFVSFLDFK